MNSLRPLHLLGIPDLDDRAFLPRAGRFNHGMRFYGKGGGAAPTPDPAIGEAALRNVELGREWLDFARDQFDIGNERQIATDELNRSVIEQQLQTQNEANTWAREDRTRTKQTFQPVEDAFIKTAQEYDSPEKQAAAAATARADVVAASEAQRGMNMRRMASMGINPESGRFAGVERTADMNTALAAAGAQNNARQVVRDKGLALKADAINMGKGLASSTAAAYGIGTNSGNSAVANNASGNQNFYANTGVMGQGFQGAIGANNSAGSMLNQLYGNQLQAWSAQQQANATSAGGIGSLIGTGIGAYAALSDIRTKQDIRPVARMENGVQLYAFRYKPEYREKWGHGMYIGVMAQEVEHIPGAVTTGEDGLKVVNYEKVIP